MGRVLESTFSNVLGPVDFVIRCDGGRGTEDFAGREMDAGIAVFGSDTSPGRAEDSEVDISEFDGVLDRVFESPDDDPEELDSTVI